MTIVDKLKAETQNLTTIMVYGNKSVFANAYERSAYAIIKIVKNYQVKVQYNRDLKTKYVSIGIPTKNVEQQLKSKGLNVETTVTEQGTVNFCANLPELLFTEEEFQTWKNHLIEEDNAKDKQANSSPSDKDVYVLSDNKNKEDGQNKLLFYQSVINDILGQQLSDYTPMMALNYLSQLQKRIRNERL